MTSMAASQQLPFRSAKPKCSATDSKAANETDVWLEKNPTEDDWDRLGQLIKPEFSTCLVTFRYKFFDQHLVGKESDRRNNGKLKKASKNVQRVIFVVGKSEEITERNFVTDTGLIKCLSLIYTIPNPYLFIPALDSFKIPLQRAWDFHSRGSVKAKSHGTEERKSKSFKILKIESDPCAQKTFKEAAKRLIAVERALKAREESDSRKKDNTAEKFGNKEKAETTEGSYVQLESKAAEVHDARKNVMTTVESDSGNRAKAMEDSDAKIGLKASKESEPRQKANAAMESNSRKKAKAREMSNCARQKLKATERESRSRKGEKTYDSEAGKGTDSNQEEEASSRPDSKNVRTCMTCGLQEPASKVFKKCRRCKDEGYPDPPYYCGRDCQVLDWTARHRQQHEKNAGDLATS